jgi:glycosyltransferase involved in cell wall biosynthesis
MRANDKFDYIFVTNLPAFYKINLYNAISKSKKIVVIFLSNSNRDRTDDFYYGNRLFEHYDLGKYGPFKKLIFCLKLLLEKGHNKLVIGGWDDPIYWILAFIFPRERNAVVVESSIYESQVDGLKGLIKKIFLRRIGTAFVSGELQKELVEHLKFRGKIRMTYGVGVLNVVPPLQYNKKSRVKNFLFVGRLSPEKGIVMLVEVFNKHPAYNLTIVGYGPLEKTIRSMINNNIKVMGEVANRQLYTIYRRNDILILPSESEPWGLVVEEALSNGVPVIVSDRVGCIRTVVRHKENGLIFRYDSEKELEAAIEFIADIDNYNRIRGNISRIDYQDIMRKQVQSYI